MNNTAILEKNLLFNEDHVKELTNALLYLYKYNKKIYEKKIKKTIKLKKNVPLRIELARNYDLLSDFIFEYNKGDEINFGQIEELPSELNMIIKSYLMPKCNIDIFISTDEMNLKSAKNINSNNNIIKKKINLNIKNDGQTFLNYISNHLPIISIPFNRVYLKIITNQDTDLTIKLKATILDDELRREVAHGKYMYEEDKTVIVGGMIGNRC
jgi:hypothetical protein